MFKSYSPNRLFDLDLDLDLDLDPMTLIYELDLANMKIYLHTKNEVPRSRRSKVRARTDRHTHTHTDTQTHRHTDTQTDRHY